MNINDKHVYLHVYDWFLQQHVYYLRDKSKVKTVKMPETKEDTFHISDKAKRQMKNDHIDKALDSGEPMTGVTYEEYCDYYYDKHGYYHEDNMRREYRQALKGDNASLREREWRTNSEYCIPIRLFDTPEVAADRQAAIQKYSRGEELEFWEKQVMYTYANGNDRERELLPAEQQRYVSIMQNRIKGALSSAGIAMGENDELSFEVWGADIKISGNIGSDTLEAVRKAFKDNNITGYGFQGIYERAHREYADEGGVDLGFLQNAEEYLQKEGSGVTIADLAADSAGNITGLPISLAQTLERDAIGEFSDRTIPSEYSHRSDDILRARYMKEAFRRSVDIVKRGEYNRFRSMTCHLTYRNGILGC